MELGHRSISASSIALSMYIPLLFNFFNQFLHPGSLFFPCEPRSSNLNKPRDVEMVLTLFSQEEQCLSPVFSEPSSSTLLSVGRLPSRDLLLSLRSGCRVLPSGSGIQYRFFPVCCLFENTASSISPFFSQFPEPVLAPFPRSCLSIFAAFVGPP